MSYTEKMRKLTEEAQAQRECRELKKRRVEQALRNLLGNKDFEIVARYLAEESNWFDDIRVLDPTSREVLPGATSYNLGSRGLYLELRRRMPDEMKRLIETKQEEKDGGSGGDHGRGAGGGTGG